MNDVKHTPGTWYWDDEVWTDYDPAERAPWLIGADGRLILTGQIRCQTKADADLISAAPELLEALIAVVSVADRATVEFDKARAAIAKARGAA